jgi:probable addiction module antidote protein
MKTEHAPLDISSYLDNEEVIAEFLTAAAEDENPDVLLSALANVAKARGMANVAEAAGLGRESLYKTLAPGAHPRFHTVQAILRALNVRMSLNAPASTKLAAKKRPAKRRRLKDETDDPRLDAMIADIDPPVDPGAALAKKAAAKKRYLAARKAAAKRAAPAKKRA